MIKIQNIYYMLSYAFTILNKKGYQKLATEEFENIADLYAAILIKGVSTQLKPGLHHEYVEYNDSLKVIRGKINVTQSIQNLDMMNKRMNCTYEEFSINTYMNQILKTTMITLLNVEISKERKKKIKRLLLYFDKVEIIDYRNIQWNFNFTRNNQAYKMLLSICKLIHDGVLQSEKSGYKQLMIFEDEQQMSRLYEKFILEYYKKEYPQLTVTASHIPWSIEEASSLEMLPIMKSDIMITYKKRCLIIDAKYYKNTLNNYFETKKIHSGNLYQIFTYVKNQSMNVKDKDITVSGMLLYAKTDENVILDDTFQMSGNQVSVKTLDLNQDFKVITEQLNKIVEKAFDLT
ncbi:5-methylcytosine-specific restriction endonuclease system specificity protein McrC [Staphylococcus croceilyticus]|uniref:5-methylcytosine-specific restriction endonuclease system specificity protein McrC n=1 Tax=Staphylococcus croceilyticus TaxID=319942 RepID=A0ABY2KJL7_9STAP|nr:5-methylcytosine-specific restriction endonuclease system specificity protein McrC [Staphylococcus croceilyticus]PNZ66493.1 5-methylcytosine-specific restriction endonuclease system specificity protein McrC [Staphylococcus croceilyticus]TGA80902.1 5-methylcytosine-specific restriction endonuclease system specificity protein McrC [Staphylococcus croceilyticus]